MENQPEPCATFVCGDCEYFVANEVPFRHPKGEEEPEPISGLCFFKPPTVQVIGKINALGQSEPALMPVRPPVRDSDRACACFESKDAPSLAEVCTTDARY